MLFESGINDQSNMIGQTMSRLCLTGYETMLFESGINGKTYMPSLEACVSVHVHVYCQHERLTDSSNTFLLTKLAYSNFTVSQVLTGFQHSVNHTGSPQDNQTVISKCTLQNSSHVNLFSSHSIKPVHTQI